MRVEPAGVITNSRSTHKVPKGIIEQGLSNINFAQVEKRTFFGPNVHRQVALLGLKLNLTWKSKSHHFSFTHYETGDRVNMVKIF